MFQDINHLRAHTQLKTLHLASSCFRWDRYLLLQVESSSKSTSKITRGSIPCIWLDAKESLDSLDGSYSCLSSRWSPVATLQFVLTESSKTRLVQYRTLLPPLFLSFIPSSWCFRFHSSMSQEWASLSMAQQLRELLATCSEMFSSGSSSLPSTLNKRMGPLVNWRGSHGINSLALSF